MATVISQDEILEMVKELSPWNMSHLLSYARFLRQMEAETEMDEEDTQTPEEATAEIINDPEAYASHLQGVKDIKAGRTWKLEELI